jgi:hypothetical protein
MGLINFGRPAGLQKEDIKNIRNEAPANGARPAPAGPAFFSERLSPQ